MMKIGIIAVVLMATMAFGQKLRVIHVSGEIVMSRTNQVLNNGDQVQATDKISYSGSQPFCLLYDGQQKLALSNTGKNSGAIGEMFELVQDRQLIATRGADESGYVGLEDYFLGPTYLMLHDEERIKLNRELYAKGDKVAFFVVDGNNNRSLLELEGNELIIPKSVIFDGEDNERKVDIYMVDTSTGEYSREATVNFKQVPADVLIEKGMLVQSMMEDKPTEEQMTETYGFITQIYGDCRIGSFEKFFKKYLSAGE